VRVLQVFNQQRALEGGEEKSVRSRVAALESVGVDVDLYMVTSRGIEDSTLRKARAAASSFYSFSSYRRIMERIEQFDPDVVEVHNIYPLVSPSVFAACRDAGVPSVFRVASQILTCPTWYHMYDGHICERCLGGKEYWCVLQDCRDNLFESALYAARNAFARKSGLYRHVTLYIAISQFMSSRLQSIGIDLERIAVVPNIVELPELFNGNDPGSYVAYAGRLSPEKGVSVLVSAARSLPQIPFRIAGDGPERPSLEAAAPSNVTFVGLLHGDDLSAFYRGARAVAMPSVTYETAGMSALEALGHGTPVIASRIGALPEAVIEGTTGILVEPGHREDLARAIARIWSDPGQAVALGAAGRNLVNENHSPRLAVTRVLYAYEAAIERYRSRSS